MTSSIDSADIDRLLREERSFHNRVYAASTPFDFPSFTFTKEDVWRYHDHTYKRDTHIKGYRTRLLFDLLDLGHIAGKRVLDVGCGNGQYSVFLAMYGAEVWGIDISDVGIEVGKRIAKANNITSNCHFLTADATKTPFDDHSFDIIMLNAVLHHAIKYPGFAEEMFRILQPGGRIVFADIVRDNGVYNLLKATYRLFRPETDSGVNIGLDDYKAFMRDYEDVAFRRLSLLESVKMLFPHGLVGTAPCRAVIYLADQLDAFLLWLVPGLKDYCLEVVGTMRKPERLASTPTTGLNTRGPSEESAARPDRTPT